MSRNEGFVLDIKDRAIITEWLIKYHERQEKSRHYEKSPDISWEQHIEVLGHTPWDGIHEASGEILCNEFIGAFLKTANVDSWWNVEYVSLEQAVALAFGKEPTEIDWEILNKLRSLPIAVSMQKFAVRMLATLFHDKERIEFIKLLEWLACNPIEDMDEKFIESITARRHDFVDWKAECKELKAQLQELEQYKPKNKSSETRQYNICLKIIAGIALEKYHFDKTKAKNNATKNIHDALLKQGIQVDEQTILDKIREGIKLIEMDSQ